MTHSYAEISIGIQKEAIINAAQQTQLKLPFLTVERFEIVLEVVRQRVSLIRLSLLLCAIFPRTRLPFFFQPQQQSVFRQQGNQGKVAAEPGN